MNLNEKKKKNRKKLIFWDIKKCCYWYKILSVCSCRAIKAYLVRWNIYTMFVWGNGITSEILERKFIRNIGTFQLGILNCKRFYLSLATRYIFVYKYHVYLVCFIFINKKNLVSNQVKVIGDRTKWRDTWGHAFHNSMNAKVIYARSTGIRTRFSVFVSQTVTFIFFYW